MTVKKPGRTPGARERVHVLACGVLAADLRALMPALSRLTVTLDLLPGRLHATPHDLRRRLQERIDAVSSAGTADRIAVAYGVCGRGTVGLRARSVPLDLPRVHDCIALFLGADAAYREQFARFPGTYYVSAGWVAEGMGTGTGTAASDARDAEREEWADRHGPENARAIADFLGSWRRNYQRAAFIDTGIGDRHHARIAREMAEINGWRYEELQGSHDLLRALLAGRPDNRIVRVAPGLVTAFDAAARCLTARPEAAAAGRQPAASRRLAAAAGAARRGRGLGIDAGGTYTDAVIYEWTSRRVRAKAKAPTSHWDYAVGIRQALDALPAKELAGVALVAVSTTLATNAIVEGKGQKVGLLLMPPAGEDDPERIAHHRPLRVIRGRLSIDGRVLEPVDPDGVRRAAREMLAEGVQAFAVTGYASHVNPAHESEVRELLHAETGLTVTCGHDVSSIRNYRVRAETAALNARIIPCLRALMERLRDVLDARGIRAPLMVVRSDGTLMNLATALERPVETLLSGPAASVAGARLLCDLPDALVMDIGGTTSDTAVLHGGAVRTDPDGATVGHWRTHVQALAVRTLGLGGDSELRHDRHGLHLGPQRVTPICRLAEDCGAAAARHCLAEEDPDGGPDGERFAVYALGPGRPPDGATARQRAVLDLLAGGPCSVLRLVRETGCLRPAFLELDGLAERQIVRRYAFTPTDALHVLGRLNLWDADLARRQAGRLGGLCGLDAETFAARVETLTVQRVARELLMTRLADLTGSRRVEVETGFVARALLDRILGVSHDALSVEATLGAPVIGIGAPAGFFLPAAAARLRAEAVIPVDGDVANAIGAITSGVRVERRATVVADERGAYHVQGLPGAPVFQELDRAQAFAAKALRRAVTEAARKAGAGAVQIDVRSEDRIARTADGMELFVGRNVTVCATGRPSTARATG